jgi:hypothetical protein
MCLYACLLVCIGHNRHISEPGRSMLVCALRLCYVYVYIYACAVCCVLCWHSIRALTACTSYVYTF